MTEPDLVTLQVGRYMGQLDLIEEMLDASFVLDDGIETADIIDRLHDFEDEVFEWVEFVKITQPESVAELIRQEENPHG
jgi:hypothetical protein